MLKPVFTCYDYVARLLQQKYCSPLSPHINIYDEGAAFPFAPISQNEPLSPSNISTASDQHRPSLLWTSACSTSFTPANRTAI